MEQIQHLLKQSDSNSKIAGLILAINHLKNVSKDNVQQDLEIIYQSMGRKFLFKLLSSPLFSTNKNKIDTKQQINTTSITCYEVALSITTAMIHNPSINNQIIAATLPLISNILAQIITFQKQNDKSTNTTLNALNRSIMECTFTMLQCYHNHNKNDSQKLIRYYIATKSNHFNQKNAEDANIYCIALSFLKYLSMNQTNTNEEKDDTQNNDEEKDDTIHALDENKKILKSIQLMILNSKIWKDSQNKSLIIAQKVFIKSLIQMYIECKTKLKFEFPQLILSIFYHLFGDTLSNETNTKDDTLHECLMQLKDICIGSLASRMYDVHRLDIFKMIQMSLLFEKHQWFINGNPNGKHCLNSEKLMTFTMSSVCTEIRINLETNPPWNNDCDANKAQYDSLDTTLNIFAKLVSYVISEEDVIDAWISTFTSKTMHTLQQDIHNAMRALLFCITELKQAVFEKNNDDGLKGMKEETNVHKKMEEYNNKFKSLTLDQILNDDCLKLLERILHGITLYISNDLVTFTDEICGILPFILYQFGDQYIGIVSNVLCKMLTNDIANTKDDNEKYKKMIITYLFGNDYLFDIVIAKCLKELELKLTNGYKQELSELFELENTFLSIALLVHDVFVFNNNRFISKLFNADNVDGCVFEVLIDMVCRISISKETQEIALPLIFVVLRVINKTSNKKLDRYVTNGIKQHIPNLIRIASACLQYEHSWVDEIAMDLVQLQQN